MRYSNDCIDIGGYYLINGETGKTAVYTPAQAGEDGFLAHCDEFAVSGVEHFVVIESVDRISHKSTFTDPCFSYTGSALDEVVVRVMKTIEERGGLYG